METNRGYQSTNKTNQSKHGTVGGTFLRFINKEAAEYAAKTFQPLYMKYIFGID